MKPSEWPTEIDQEFERQVDEILDRKGVRYRKENHPDPDYGYINYEIQTKPGLDLELSFQLSADQLGISFDGCYLMLELAMYVPKFGENPDALEEWKDNSLREVEAVLGSDLRVVSRSRGESVLGGYLYRWDGDNWKSVGGGGWWYMFLGRKRVKDYRSWLA